MKHVLFQAGTLEKDRIKSFLLHLLECGDMDGLPEKILKCDYLTELFSMHELEEISSKTTSAVHNSALDIPELLLKTDWDMPDFTESSKLL